MNAHNNSTRTPGQNLAILAESLYVANLLLIPFIGFIVLALLFLKYRGRVPALAQSHLEQTVKASIWIAVMSIGAAGIVMVLSSLGMEDVTLWILVVLLFTILHATMVLLGVVGLAKALSGRCWRYPFFGSELPRGCSE